jgi:hypothetical protein
MGSPWYLGAFAFAFAPSVLRRTKTLKPLKQSSKNIMWENITIYCIATSIVLYFEVLSNSLREYLLSCALEPWHP